MTWFCILVCCHCIMTFKWYWIYYNMVSVDYNCFVFFTGTGRSKSNEGTDFVLKPIGTSIGYVPPNTNFGFTCFERNKLNSCWIVWSKVAWCWIWQCNTDCALLTGMRVRVALCWWLLGRREYTGRETDEQQWQQSVLTGSGLETVCSESSKPNSTSFQHSFFLWYHC